MFRSVLINLFIVSLVGCSYLPKTTHIQNRETHYLTAKSIPPLRIPPGISTSDMQSYYPVADNNNAADKKVNLLPPGL